MLPSKTACALVATTDVAAIARRVTGTLRKRSGSPSVLPGRIWQYPGWAAHVYHHGGQFSKEYIEELTRAEQTMRETRKAIVNVASLGSCIYNSSRATWGMDEGFILGVSPVILCHLF